MIQYMSGRYFHFSFWDHVYFLGTLQQFLLWGVEDEHAVPRGLDAGFGRGFGLQSLPFVTAGLLPACLGCSGALGFGGPETLF